VQAEVVYKHVVQFLLRVLSDSSGYFQACLFADQLDITPPWLLPARIFLATPSIELEVFDTMLRYMLLCVEALACYGAPSWCEDSWAATWRNRVLLLCLLQASRIFLFA
jgi:hypothetical protein